VELLDVRELLEKAVKSADSMILTAKKLENKEIQAVDCNALVNGYRSAGTLYIATANAIEGSKIVVQNNGAPVELSQETKDKLDEIARLLVKKPSKRKKKGEAGNDEK